MPELLLEVRCEEVPARMLAPAVKQLASRLFEVLMERHLTPDKTHTGFTPRRLVVAMSGIATQEPDREEEATGPPVQAGFDAEGKPTAAALGFARRCGVAPEDLRTVSTPKGEYLAATVKTEGRPTREVLSELLAGLLRDLAWPKTMRWGAGVGPWARPIHGIVALFDGEIVPFELFGVVSGASTCGHPVLSPRFFDVREWSDYRRKLGRRKIEVRFDERRRTLAKALTRAAAAAGGNLVEDEVLLERLTAMCAIPGVVSGSFDRRFLELPREVLIASLRDHQSAFCVEADGELLPSFLTLMDRSDDPKGRVRAGNEWVAEARLSDAAFFFAEDRKRSLSERRPDLERLSFHVALGSYAEKTERIEALCRVLCGGLGLDESETEHAVAAAGLLKADLVTEMVKEFTSLQGVMGGLYARADGHPEEVWRPIYEQYLPAATSDPLPASRVGQIVGLADRIDTVVGMLGIGLVPSGSKDPFGLRRAAQGIVRIALEGELPVDLDLIAAKACQAYGSKLESPGKEVLAVWRPFIFDRVRHVLGLEGFAYDEIEAALEVGATNLPDLRSRVEALHAVRDEPDFLTVVLAAKRIANILREADEQTLNEELLTEDAEQRLYNAYLDLKKEVREAEDEARYEQCFRAMAAFADVLDRFFVEVLVMDENRDLRNNRIALLQSIQRVLSRTASLTAMVVERKTEDGEDG
jgi:glycyl-tRNA synthetase beta chain